MKTRVTLVLMLAAMVAASCSTGDDVNELVQTAIAQTELARLSATPPTSTSSSTPEILPTDTFTPQPTPTETLGPQPVVFEDDFSNDTGNWLGCEQCKIERDALFMGPWESQERMTNISHSAGTADMQCITGWQWTSNFMMDQPPRGYGFVLFISEEFAYTVEITSFQTVALWQYDFESGAWDLLDGAWTGAVRGGELVNRVEAEIQPGTSPGRVNIFIRVNGSTAIVVYNRLFDFTPVGLTLFGHAAEIRFANFEFESYEPYGPPMIPSDLEFSQPSI